MAVTKFLARDISASILLSGTPSIGSMTGVATTDVVTTGAPHGMVAGTPFKFISLTGGAGITLGTIYWVIASGIGASVFKFSATYGGAAFDFTTDITVGTAQATFTAIGGVHTLTHAPKTTDTATTTFASGGHEEHLVGERGEEWTLAGFTLEDVAVGTSDAGQDGCKQLAKQLGLSSLGIFRIASPGGNAITFYASAELTLPGGGNNDAAAWQCKLTVSGAPTFTP